MMACCMGFFATDVHAQLDVTQGYTVEEYVNDVLLGEGVTAFNISYVGGMDQLGQLVNGDDSQYAFDEGLVMSTANSRGIGCSSSTCGDCLGDAVTDSALLSLANSVPELIGQSFTVESLHDVSILEFDFIVTGDSIGFDYIFGSDEYEQWINTPYNDVFGFFLSGPGIEGPYASPAGFPGGAINIAGVPGSDPNLPITVSSVNSTLNSEFYVANLPYDGICINGYTAVFHAGYPVQCGEVYHIKLAIADGTDTGLESVVILEQGSFVSNVPVQVSESLDVGGEGENVIFEGCGMLTWTFDRPYTVELSEDYMVLLGFDEGAAVNGEDFGQLLPDGSVQPFSDTLLFPAGVASQELTLIALTDTLAEGNESLIMTIASLNSCADGFMYLTYEVSDGPDPIVIDGFSTLACSNVQIVVEPEVTGGIGNYEYSWSCSTSSAPYITVTTDENWSCVLTVTDTCGLEPASAINTISLLDSEPLTVDLHPDSIEIIAGDSVFTSVTIEGGLSLGGNYSTNWFVNGDLVQAGFDTLFEFQPALFDMLTVEVEDGCGNEAMDALFIDAFYYVDAVITVLDSSLAGPDSAAFYACSDIDLAFSPSASISISETVAFYGWNWGDGTIEYTLADTVQHEWDEPGIYAVTLLMGDDYGNTDESEPVYITVFPRPSVQFLADTPICLGGFGEAEVNVQPASMTQTVAYQGPSIQLADTVVQTFTFELEVDQFSDSAVIEDCSDVKKIRAKLEHAHVGALDMWVTCPDGSELVLLSNNVGEMDDCNGGADVDAAYLGVPVVEAGNDTAGVGYTYTWREYGFYVLDDADNSALEGGTINPGSYTSCNDWCALQGCPVNGTWTLNIATEDSLGDGHFFDWNIQFEHGELDSLGLSGSDALDLSSGGFNWGSLPESANIVEDSTGMAATYEAIAIGSHLVSFTAVDAFGCTNTRYRTIVVNDGLGFAVDAGPNPNACADVQLLSASLVNTAYTDCPGMPFSNSWCIGNNQDTVFTVCPMIQGDGTYMHLMMSSAELDSLGDFVQVFDGPDTSSPLLGTYSGDLSNTEWAAENPTGCLTFRVVTNDSLSCGDGAFGPIDFTIDCNPFFLDVLYLWQPGAFVLDSISPNTEIISGSTETEFVIIAYVEDQPTCFSSDTVNVTTQLSAEWLAFHPDCDVSNGTLVIDVDSPGYSGDDWLIELTVQDTVAADSSAITYSQYSNGDPNAFTFLPNGIYGVNVSNDNCDWDAEVELNALDNPDALPCGCTYWFFPNYDPEALIDDGSCEFGPGGGGGGGGCNYESWCEENYEDGCQADLNEDGVITVGDLLELMSVYGDYCDGTVPN